MLGTAGGWGVHPPPPEPPCLNTFCTTHPAQPILHKTQPPSPLYAAPVNSTILHPNPNPHTPTPHPNPNPTNQNIKGM